MTSSPHINEINLKVLRAVESYLGVTQRELASELVVSLGKAHYCMKAFIDRGLAKMGNFSHNQKKLDYAYPLTPSNIKPKAILTVLFLKPKVSEYAMPKSQMNKHENDI